LCTEVKIRKTDEIIKLKYSNNIYIYPDQTKTKTEAAEQLSVET